jgi:hypothetical protein
VWSESKILIPAHVLERVFPKEAGGVHAPDARNVTARLNEAAGFPLPNLFFHYDPAGKPLGGRPLVRFGSFSAGISVQGVGEEGADLVEGAAHHVRRLWSRHLDTPLVEQRYSGQCSIDWSARPVDYYIHQLLVDPPASWWEARHGLEELKPVLAQAIKRSLLAEIESLHGRSPGVVNSDVLNEIDGVAVELVSVDSLRFKHLNPGSGGKAALPCARGVRFRLPVSLSGVWHLGRLCSRGFGKVRRDFGAGRLGDHADPFRRDGRGGMSA